MLKSQYSIFYTHLFQRFESGYTPNIARLRGYTSGKGVDSGTQSLVLDITTDENYCFCVTDIKQDYTLPFYLVEDFYLNSTPLDQVASGSTGLYLNSEHNVTKFRRFSPVKFPINPLNSKPHIPSTPTAPDNYLYDIAYQLVEQSSGTYYTFEVYSGTIFLVLPIDMFISTNYQEFIPNDLLVEADFPYDEEQTYFYKYTPRESEFVRAISPNDFELSIDRLPSGSGLCVMYTADEYTSGTNLVVYSNLLGLNWGNPPVAL